MTVIDILQGLQLDTERLLAPLDDATVRLYEISTTGALTERTAQMREFYGNLRQQLQRCIDLSSR